MATFTEIINKVEPRLVDIDDNAYSDNLMLEFYNDGVTDLAETDFYIKEEVVALTGANKVVASDLSYKMRRVFGIGVGTSRIFFSPAHEMQLQVSTAGTPVWWSWRGDTVQLSAGYTGNVTVIYSAYPTDLSATDSTLDTSVERFSEPLAAYVEARIRQSEEDELAAARAMDEYRAAKANLSAVTAEQMLAGGYGA